MKCNRLTVVCLGFLACWVLSQNANAGALRAGVASVDVSPTKFPVIVNGGFLAARASQLQDHLFARTVALDDGSGPITITVVDSCMMPRDLLDKAKTEASAKTGIPAERMLISATHTHTAPSAMGALGTPPDADYVAMLPGLIAQSIIRAAGKMQPARIGQAVVKDFEHTHTRRWIRRPDKMTKDPFGVTNVRANMHPGYLNPDVIGPSGPVDPALSVISVQTADGRPLAVLANYSMHYFGTKPVSADYFGVFSAKIGQLLGVKDGEGFVGIMSQGTSGDQHWMDYGKAKLDIPMQAYAEAIAERAHKALQTVQYKAETEIAMAQATLKLVRRLPDAKRLEWARDTKARMAGREAKDVGEVYACEAIELDANPNRELILQAIRIGSLGITAIPNEVYAITGLKLKAASPLETTVNIELANGSEGYIPTPEQHKLGGYTTWPARTAGLEETAEPKIVDTVLTLLEKVAGKPRRPMPDTLGSYASTVIGLKPLAYWRMEEISGQKASDASGSDHSAMLEDGVALYLPGPISGHFTKAGQINRAAHFAGGRLLTDALDLKETYTLSLWFWNGMPADARAVTGHLLQMPGGEMVSIGGKGAAEGKIVLGGPGSADVAGKTVIMPKRWHHLTLTREGKSLKVYLNGQLEASGLMVEGQQAATPGRLTIGGRADGNANFEGKLDEIAIFDRNLNLPKLKTLFEAAGDVADE